jgi:hypothetical protein
VKRVFGLQLIYTCEEGKCAFAKSLVQTMAVEENDKGVARGVRCLCGRAVYLEDEGVYACRYTNVNPEHACGFYVHELDSLTYWEIKINDDEDFGWLKRYPPRCDCGERCVFKHLLKEDLMIGELVFKCKKDKCSFVDNNIF